ncbi:MAG: thiol:disulfide interchange protein DsbA/DsbL [Gammaproteobacteria bacterium]|jgi:protein dithiol oxidoreductase (disulfide-forming)|nr:thiol:disulfide interchange protein DsbA/DsbL [Gammaproteobacteria bacterium]MBU2178991.1 thiol:disulfide interchange protein DsbA/DsbL [Gammaproteobacteria bacterium]MBU2223388.1 thiol:disulfide interchange protein DsbA/DsbL [Gammaproteobacteria bacterium]MBU2280077.1 thiol:disulfide interchange protein DsbA/DsbL [Gammaproteobacteria bacterium]MBU2428434.1 thiol:disulfide interchange protein DsbA/DsbL [Gammaproteobacteria bacterium]
MKKLMFLLATMLLAPAVMAQSKYEEGVHYEVISEQGTAKPELKEFFSFYCPHCNSIDSLVQSVAKTLPEGTVFKKYHVDFMGGASPDIQKSLTVAMILAKTQGKGEEVTKAFFNHIHKEHKAFASDADIREVAITAGIDPAVYDKNLNNFTIKSQASLMQKEQNALSKARVLNSVPTFIVNGRFKIDVAKLDAKNMEQDFKNLVAFLLKQP